jgi:uncharacterized membrane protein YtjA (UPF0391 family)
MLPPGTRFSKTQSWHQTERGLPDGASAMATGHRGPRTSANGFLRLLEPVPFAAVTSATSNGGRHSGARMPEDRAMTILKWALIFFLVSIVAGIFGFTGISAASADVARFLFYVFVVIFLVLLILGLTIFRV